MNHDLLMFLLGVAASLLPVGWYCRKTLKASWAAHAASMHERYSAFQAVVAGELHNAKAEAQAEAAKVEGEIKKL